MTGSDLLAWLTGESFRGVPGIPELVVEHLVLSAAALGLALALAVPPALALGHLGRGGTVAINVANAFRAVPAFGLVLLAFTLVGFSLPLLVVVFALIGVAPIFTNTYVGIRSVDADVNDAAAGMGLSGWQRLRQVEIPLASPVIMAGVRTAAVNIVATVTLAALVGFDGLGRPLLNGLAQGPSISSGARALVLVGAGLVAAVSIGAEVSLGLVERRVVPPGLRDRTRRAADDVVRERGQPS